MHDADVGTHRRDGGEPLAGERARDPGDPGALREVVALVAADDAEGELRSTRRVRRRHSGVRMLFQLQRLGPAMFDRVAQAMERADARIAAPGEDELARAAHADQLVVDDVRRHAHERQVTPSLPDQLVAGGMGDEMREALECDDVPVTDELLDRLGDRNDLSHARSL